MDTPRLRLNSRRKVRPTSFSSWNPGHVRPLSAFTPRRDQTKELPDALLEKLEAYTRECEKNGIIPMTRDIAATMVTKKAVSSVLVGDRQIAAGCVAGLIGDQPQIQLRDSNIGEQGAVAVAKVLGKGIVSLDMAGNSVGARGIRALVSAPTPNLQTLNLCMNGLGDAAILALRDGLNGGRTAPRLVNLLLAENHIARSGRELGAITVSQKRLELLDLHWNYLTGDSALYIFEGLPEGGVSRLDLSWNCLAHARASAAMASLAQALRLECALMHLDLSYNALQARECQVLADGLRDNHALLGLHLVGNAAGVDEHGFVIPAQTQKPSSLRPAGLPELLGEFKDIKDQKPLVFLEERRAIRATFKRLDADGSGEVEAAELLTGLNALGIRKSAVEVADIVARADKDGNKSLDINEFTELMESTVLAVRRKELKDRRGQRSKLAMGRERSYLEARTSCWICEGWRPVEISWEGDARAVWAFTSLDDFQRATQLTKNGDRFFCRRMLPPNEIQIILQVDNGASLVAGLPTARLPEPVSLRMRRAEALPPTENTTLTVSEVSVLLPKNCFRSRAPARAVVIDDPCAADTVAVTPRITETEYKAVVEKRPWTFTDSIFASWKFESKHSHHASLLADWLHAKVPKFVKNQADVEAVAMAATENYGSFLRLFRRCAASSSDGSSSFGVSMNACSELLLTAGLVDTQFCRLADVDTMFIAARVRDKGSDKRQFVTRIGDTLLRFQFLEFLVRVAVARFVKTNEAKTVAEGLRMVFQGLQAQIASPASDLRELHQQLHTEACDELLRDREGFLMAVYRKNSGKHAKPGEEALMCCKEFEKVLADADAFTDTFPLRDCPYAFLMGLRCQVDELFNTAFDQMSFVEFLHGLGAAAFLQRNSGPLAQSLARLLSSLVDCQAANSVLSALG